MITNLDDILYLGAPWPPRDSDERARQVEHLVVEKVFNDLHNESGVFKQYWTYLKDQGTDEKKVEILLGWPMNAAFKFLSLLTGEPPKITASDSKRLEEFLRKSSFLEVLDEVAIDFGRYGVGIFQAYYSDEKSGIYPINPKRWIPVLSVGNKRIVKIHVIYDLLTIEEEKETKELLKVALHEAECITHRVYELKAGLIDRQYSSEEVAALLDLEVDSLGQQLTGVDQSLIVVLHNQMTSERWYGRTEYGKSIQSLLQALELAFARRHLALSKMSQPTPYGPDTAFTPDESAVGLGRMVFRPDQAIRLAPEDKPPGALTWDIMAAAQERQIEDLFKQLVNLLDLSLVLLAGEERPGVMSGTALKLALIPTLAKVRRYRAAFHIAIPEILSLALALDGAWISPEEIDITWSDGIPDDPREVSEILRNLLPVGGISIRRALSLQGLEGDELEAELKELKGDEEWKAGLGL